jgi:hypothetical protein
VVAVTALSVAPFFAVVLHASHGQEVTLMEYLSRVLLTLFAVGGIAALVFWGIGVADAVRAAFRRNGNDENDP